MVDRKRPAGYFVPSSLVLFFTHRIHATEERMPGTRNDTGNKIEPSIDWPATALD